jgi:iron(III) transport system permease protein
MSRLGLQQSIFVSVTAVIGFLVLYPIGMLLIGAFASNDGSMTTQHWRDVLASPILGEVVFNTVFVSIVATTLAIVFGLSFAFLVSRTDLPMRSTFEHISILPFLTPPIIAGLAWQQLAEEQSGIINIFLRVVRISWRFNIMSLGGDHIRQHPVSRAVRLPHYRELLAIHQP